MELMAPVGSRESLQAALDAGCDSVYFGVSQLNMRARASSNFKISDLKEVSRCCQERSVRSYLALNTLLYDHDLRLSRSIMEAAQKAEISAVICADMAALTLAHELGLPIHISTQLSVSNLEAVRFYARYAEAIVLARELTLPMVARITRAIEEQDIRGPSGKRIRIEIFGHGALCVAVSGRCSMSLLTENSSGNRGACKQNCRREYLVTDPETGQSLKIENNYVLSPTDLCTIGLLPEIVAAGVEIFKIEGRGRSADYVDRVVRTYREAFVALEEETYTRERIAAWNRDLKTVYNRGLSEGTYLGKPFQEWSGYDGNKATHRREFVGRVEKFYSKISILQMTIQDSPLSSQDSFQVVGETTGILRGHHPEIWCEENCLEVAPRGTQITFKVAGKVRPGDRVYRLVETEFV
jgi:putative protease